MRWPLVFAAIVAGVGLSCASYAAAQPVEVKQANSGTSAARENAVARPEHVRLMREYIRLLEAKDIDGWIKLWAADGVLEMPFAPGGGEPQLIGREIILEHFRTTPGFFSRIDYSEPVVRSLAGGNSFLAEFTGNLEVRATGRPYRSDYAMLVEVENGRIKLLREYFNPEALAYARGDLPANASQGGADDAWVRAFFATVDSRDPDRIAAHFDEDIRLTFGPGPAVVGRAAARRAFADTSGRYASVRHDLRGIWRGRADGQDVVSAEALVTYAYLDGRTVSAPVTSTLRLKPGLRIADYRIFMDMSALAASTAAAPSSRTTRTGSRP